MKVNQKILIPCKTSVESIREEQNKENVNDGVIIKGKLISCGVPTRNGISYTLKSMQEFINKFTNDVNKTIPFLDSHDDSSIRKSPPFGHITKLWIQGHDVFYEANIDSTEELFLRKLSRGDVREVSLQAIVDAVDEWTEQNGDTTIIADVRELLEISSVLIPGARDTSIEIQEGYLSEERFTEVFNNARKKNITFKESLKQYVEAKDNNELMGGQVKEPAEEELNTSNGSALIGVGLSKKIKKVPEEIIRRSEYLRIISRRI
jgi:phage head maturation protease